MVNYAKQDEIYVQVFEPEYMFGGNSGGSSGGGITKRGYAYDSPDTVRFTGFFDTTLLERILWRFRAEYDTRGIFTVKQFWPLTRDSNPRPQVYPSGEYRIGNL